MANQSENSTFDIIAKDEYEFNKLHINMQGCTDISKSYLGLDLINPGLNVDLCSHKIDSVLNSSLGFGNKLKCPMCHGGSSSFYCADCVRNGNFYHSTVKIPERFAEKRLRERKIGQYIESLAKKAPDVLARKSRRKVLEQRIEAVKERIKLTEKVIENERNKIKTAHAEETRLRFQAMHIEKALPSFLKKNKNMMLNIHLYQERIPDKKDQVNELEIDFQKAVKERVMALTDTIYPLKEIPSETCSSSEEDRIDPENEETLKGLAEALQTHYVRGKWITSTHFTPIKSYSIMSIVLPGLADYSSLINHGEVIGDDETERRNCQTICAGLASICQLVNVLAFHLAVHLPKRVSFRDFSDFGSEEMKQSKFQKLVMRLNANVFYLCLSQGVPLDLIHPLRPLPNLIALLNSPQTTLGRMGSFEVAECALDTLEEGGLCDALSDSDSEEDWETFSSDTVLECMPPMPSGTFFRRSSVDETASGIVTSAAASVMSIIRGIGTPLK